MGKGSVFPIFEGGWNDIIVALGKKEISLLNCRNGHRARGCRRSGKRGSRKKEGVGTKKKENQEVCRAFRGGPPRRKQEKTLGGKTLPRYGRRYSQLGRVLNRGGN